MIETTRKSVETAVLEARILEYEHEWEATGLVPNAPGPVREICRLEALRLRVGQTLGPYKIVEQIGSG